MVLTLHTKFTSHAKFTSHTDNKKPLQPKPEGSGSIKVPSVDQDEDSASKDHEQCSSVNSFHGSLLWLMVGGPCGPPLVIVARSLRSGVSP